MPRWRPEHFPSVLSKVTVATNSTAKWGESDNLVTFFERGALTSTASLNLPVFSSKMELLVQNGIKYSNEGWNTLKEHEIKQGRSIKVLYFALFYFISCSFDGNCCHHCFSTWNSGSRCQPDHVGGGISSTVIVTSARGIGQRPSAIQKAPF